MREKVNGYTYWKRPWHKWVMLTGAILQLICLCINISEYKNIYTAGILNANEWVVYAAQKNFQCAINGLIAVCFLGSFIIGIFTRSKKMTYIVDCVFLIILSFLWITLGILLGMFLPDFKGVFWVFIVFLELGGACYSFLQYKKIV